MPIFFLNAGSTCNSLAGSNEWNYRIKDLAEAVGKIFPGGLEISINSNAMPDKRSYRVDFSLFKSLAANFQPQCDLFTTIHHLKNGLLALGFNDKNFRHSHLVRLNTLAFFLEKGLLTEQLSWSFK